MAKEEESDLKREMQESVTGRIYRCRACDSAYYVLRANIIENGDFSVAAINLTSNIKVFITPKSAKYDLIEIERGELEIREKRNLRDYLRKR